VAEGFLDFKTNPTEYLRARLREAMVEADLAEEMLRRGLFQNAANKAFMALKALLSALVVKELSRLPVDERRREWYMRVGYSAPTTGIIRIARDLEALGYSGVELMARIALMLHRFAYNGFDPNFVDYVDEEEVAQDIARVISFVREMASRDGSAVSRRE